MRQAMQNNAKLVFLRQLRAFTVNSVHSEPLAVKGIGGAKRAFAIQSFDRDDAMRTKVVSFAWCVVIIVVVDVTAAAVAFAVVVVVVRRCHCQSSMSSSVVIIVDPRRSSAASLIVIAVAVLPFLVVRDSV